MPTSAAAATSWVRARTRRPAAAFAKALERDAGAAKRIDQAWADAYISRGRNLLGQGKDDEAKAAFAKALEHDAGAAKRVDRG